MSKSKAEKEREKVIQDRCQLILAGMLREEDNKYCVDCDSKGPRWASWNLGVFLCIRCAGIHRNLGVHISKVRSVNLDSWTPLQVSHMQCMGNSRGRAVYEANLPEDYRRPTSDSGMEAFIRNKYEKKKFIAKEWVPTKPPDLPVGWDKLIEQERLPKDAAKKMTVQNNNNNIAAVSANKKPVEASKPVATSSPAPSATATSTAPTTTDLLGLTSTANTQKTTTPSSNALEDDLFGFSGFVSASPASVASEVTTTGNNVSSTSTAASNSSETDFFNQVQVSATEPPTSVDTSKMSNSSIMALFANSGASKPSFPGGQGVPGLQGVAPGPPQGLPQMPSMFGAAPQQNLMGVQGHPLQQPGQFPGQPGLFPGQLAGSFPSQPAFNNNAQANNPFMDLAATQQQPANNQLKMINSLPQNVLQMNSQLLGMRLGGPANQTAAAPNNAGQLMSTPTAAPNGQLFPQAFQASFQNGMSPSTIWP